MKKVKSYYNNNYYNYTYYYETKEVELRERTSLTSHAKQFQTYFGKKYATFNNIKEFKVALYNFSQYINEDIIFEHYNTTYQEDNYIITKDFINKKWLITLNIDVNKNEIIEFKYGTIECPYYRTIILLNKAGLEKIHKEPDKILDNKDFQNHEITSYKKQKILKIQRPTIKETIKDFKYYLIYFEIKAS